MLVLKYNLIKSKSVTSHYLKKKGGWSYNSVAQHGPRVWAPGALGVQSPAPIPPPQKENQWLEIYVNYKAETKFLLKTFLMHVNSNESY
jgi:hypothetical protein